MKIEIKPALKPEHRHALAKVLAEIVAGVGRMDGGGTNMDGTECDIYIKPKEGFTDTDIRIALTGTAMEPPWPLPEIDIDKLPTEIPEDMPKL